MKDYQDIRFNASHGVAAIEIHRPEHLNSCTGRMGLERQTPQWKLNPNEGPAEVAGLAGSMKVGVTWM